MVELLSPAGNLEKLKVAIHYGADAIYVGLKDFSLRANATNFDEDELKEAIQYTHERDKKIYVAINVYFTPNQTAGIIEKLKFLEKLRVDGIIISDLGVIKLAKEYAPSINIHISTQANTTNEHAVMFYRDIGIKRVILSRELSLENIKIIKSLVPDVELEVFVHGAMCIAYSGRCLLSSYMTKNGLTSPKTYDLNNKTTRSANKGDCSHSCRWEYFLIEKSRPNDNFIIDEDINGSYILSSKDLAMIDYLDELIEAGINSFKIEGRMKSILYISSIIRSYRNKIDHYYDKSIQYNRKFIEKELSVVSHREFCTGFFYDSPKNNSNVITTETSYQREMRLGAMVENKIEDRVILKIFNRLSKNDKLEYISLNFTKSISKIYFFDNVGNTLDNVNNGQYVEAIFFDENNDKIIPQKFDIIRIETIF